MPWPDGAGQTLQTASATYNPPNILGGAQASTTVSVPGAALGDFAMASFGISQAGITVSAYVSAADVVTVVFFNGTGADVDLSSSTLRVKVIKQ